MATIKHIFKGESLSMLFAFPLDYDMSRIQSHGIWIGRMEFTGVIIGQGIELKLTSLQTDMMSGNQRVSLWIDDTILGVRKPYVGDIAVGNTNALSDNDSTSEVYDVIVNVDISVTSIEAGDLMFNYVKGDPLTYDDLTPEQKAELQQPATDAIASIQEVELAVEQAEGLRVQAELNRQTNTSTAISNAEQATDDANDAALLANEKAGLANEKAELANEKAGLAATATTQANTARDGANSAAQSATNLVNSYATDLAAKELKANKQNSLAVDGTGTKFPTVDAVNAGLVAKTAIKQAVGTSETDVMSQKAVTDGLALKASHGYASSPKTLKEVDDEVIQLAGEVNKVFPRISTTTYPASLPIPAGFFKIKDINNDLVEIQRKENAFIITVKTDNPGATASNQFQIPCAGNYTIDWGDGVIEAKTGSAIHTYPSAGVYVIKITGNLYYIRYANASDRLKLLEINNWGSIKWTSFQDSFFGCENLKLKATDFPDLNLVAVFQRAFSGCTSFTGNESMKSWDMSNVTNAQSMFNTSGFNTDITDWRFSKNLTIISGFWYKSQIGIGGVPDSDVMNNYIIKLANWAFESGAPVNVISGGNGKYYTNKKYNVDGQFNNALDAMLYLTNTLNWTWSEGSLYREVLQDGQFDKGYMVLGIDDGYSSWVNLFLPLLTAKNKKATFFVANNYCDGVGAHATWEQIKQLYDAGQNIESHAWTHQDLAILTEKKLIDEIDKIDKKFLELGIPKSMHISYPFGSHSDNVKKWLQSDTFLKTGRKTRINPPGVNPEFDGMITTKIDKFAIPAEPFTGTITNLQKFKDFIDEAKAEKKAFVVYGHEFTTIDENVINGNWITIELVSAIFDYCDSVGVEIITHDKLYTLLDNKE